jgi:membrane-anchored protein YejM (alkaline phosphatase superfamily)
MPAHNDFRAMLQEVKFSEEHPSFYLLNVGETHYPYALAGEPRDTWPTLNGVHGVFKHLDQHTIGGKIRRTTFHAGKLKELRARQVDAVRFLDRQMEQLFDTIPQNTFITITSDHGELFGEDGYFGHGPIQHPKVFEVPFVEGKIR